MRRCLRCRLPAIDDAGDMRTAKGDNRQLLAGKPWLTQNGNLNPAIFRECTSWRRIRKSRE